MKDAIDVLSMVALTEDLPKRGLYRGQVGTVVETLAPMSSRSSSPATRDAPTPRLP